MNYSNFTNKDIINGRGQGVQRLPGNVMFRKLVNAHKQTYAQAPWKDKEKISKGIVTALRRFGFNFLEFDKKTGCYRDIEYKKVLYKTSQALREGQANIKRLELAAGKMDDSKSSSFVTSTNTSTEVSCVNYSIQQLLQLLGEDKHPSEEKIMGGDQLPPQNPTPTPTPSKQSSKRDAQQETKENDVPKHTPLPNQSVVLQLQFVSDAISKKRHEYGGLTVDTLRDVAIVSGDYADLKADAVQSEHTVMDRSAFLEASSAVAKYSSAEASNIKSVRSANFHDESFLETFLQDPTTAAGAFITCYELVKNGANKDIINNLLNTFVDVMSPLGSEKRRAPVNVKRIDDFPLKELLSLFVDNSQMVFGKRVIEGYIWLSCQDILSERAERNGMLFCNRTSPSGPKLLVSACDPLVSICNALGWNELENVLLESVEMLCKYQNTEVAVLLVDKIAPATPEGQGHRFRICSKMAKIACDKMIDELREARQYRSAHHLPLYKKLLWLVGNYCPRIAPKFVTLAKNLDVDVMLYPLLTDDAIRSGTSADEMKNTLNQLTVYCVELLNSREAKLDAIRRYLPPSPDQDANRAYLTPSPVQLSCQKRKAADALASGNDDDDLVLTGVAGVVETNGKRVKVAEDAGEVIDILCEMKKKNCGLCD